MITITNMPEDGEIEDGEMMEDMPDIFESSNTKRKISGDLEDEEIPMKRRIVEEKDTAYSSITL